MSIEGMVGAWNVLHDGAQEFYSQTGQYLRNGAPLDYGPFSEMDGLLDQMLDASQELRRQAEPELDGSSSERYQQVSEWILAGAAVDAMLARDIAALDPEIGYTPLDDAVDEASSTEEMDGERRDVLNDVNDLFRGPQRPLAGAALDPSRAALIEEVRQSVARLVDSAEEPARDLVKGLLASAGGGALDVFSAAHHVAVLDKLEEAARKLTKHAPRFLREHVAKIVALHPEDVIVDDVADLVVARANVKALLQRVADTRRTIELTTVRITNGPVDDVNPSNSLLGDLTSLEGGFRTQMGWMGKSARWLRRGAKPLGHLSFVALGPAGYAVIPGVFFVGLGYVGYALTDRLDARDLKIGDRVEGVVRIVTRNIPLTVREPPAGGRPGPRSYKF